VLCVWIWVRAGWGTCCTRGILPPAKSGERRGLALGGLRLPRCEGSAGLLAGCLGAEEQGWGRAVGGEVWAGGRGEGGGDGAAEASQEGEVGEVCEGRGTGGVGGRKFARRMSRVSVARSAR
jgi:hypothetical protein